ncbi:MAG: translation initiation factor IF-3 [Anaerolineae bacterium]|nr:translation initiation factor IF-3 [Anaerolineae bacterium]NUQ04546.1 translation initiation factor IF-3 [Anaerolineae bacterium]
MNNQIRAREVRVISDTKENMGVMSIGRALELAESRGLDLVEVSPEADPPVCRVMDFGKFQYEQSRKERKAKKQQKVIEVKEIRLSPKTDDHHLSFKVRDARKWIMDGMKVRVRIRFRGREITHANIGFDRLQKIAAELNDVAVIEQSPNMEGTTMLMVLAPGGKPAEKKA